MIDMKRYWLFCLLLFAVLVSFVACGADEDYGDDEAIIPTVEDLEGCWTNADKSLMLQVNDAGQVWYIDKGDIVFRGYFRQESEEGGIYPCRFDLYTDADMRISYFYYDSTNGLMEYNVGDDYCDTYAYDHSFNLFENPYCGTWFIQGLQDSYCLNVKHNETWQLRFPGAEGEIVASGVGVSDPFGGYEFVIDSDRGINLGSGEIKDGYMEFGVSSTSPVQFEPFGLYSFYSEEKSAPRISVGNYAGWWNLEPLADGLKLETDGTWTVFGSGEETEASGVYEVTDSGLALEVVSGDGAYYPDGVVLNFAVQSNNSLYCEDTTMSLVPSYEKPY